MLKKRRGIKKDRPPKKQRGLFESHRSEVTPEAEKKLVRHDATAGYISWAEKKV